MGKAIYNTIVNGESKWVHVSEGTKTVQLRWFGPEYKEPEELKLSNPKDEERWKKIRTGKKFSLTEITALTDDVLSFSANKLSVKDIDVDNWGLVFERLHQLGNITPVDKDNDDTPVVKRGAESLIPQTRMRRFYEMMRILNEAKLQGSIAKYLTEKNRSDRIQVMFKESEFHFTRFTNTGEAFHSRVNPDWLEAYIEKSDAFAKCVVARLRPNANFDPVAIKGGPNIRVVDYELSLFRTTGGAAFEDGKAGSSSGSGGMDLLIQDSDTGTPVVGEIKAPTDRDLFLALIQALTYATELTTPNQLSRVAQHYHFLERPFVCDASSRQCDIYLIYEEGSKPKLMKETKALATQLLANPNSPVARRIRRIALVSAKLIPHTEIALTWEWATAIR